MAIDAQMLIQFVLGCACTLGGWFLRVLWDSVAELRRELAQHKVEIARSYVPWDRMGEALRPIHDALERIENALSGKVDKP